MRGGGSELQFDGEPLGREGASRLLRSCFLADEITGAQAGEVDGALWRSEAAGDFGLHLHYPQVLLGEIVGERNRKIGEDPEGRRLEALEPNEAICERGAASYASSDWSRDRSGEGRGLLAPRPNSGLRTPRSLRAQAPWRPAPWCLAPPPWRPGALRAGLRPRAPCRIRRPPEARATDGRRRKHDRLFEAISRGAKGRGPRRRPRTPARPNAVGQRDRADGSASRRCAASGSGRRCESPFRRGSAPAPPRRVSPMPR